MCISRCASRTKTETPPESGSPKSWRCTAELAGLFSTARSKASASSSARSRWAEESKSWRTRTAPIPKRNNGSTERSSVASTPSSPRIASGGNSGTASRTAHGTSNNGWAGSSRVQPHSCRANEVSGTSRVRVSTLSLRKSAAWRQYSGTSRYAPVGSNRPDHTGATDNSAITATPSPAAARRVNGCLRRGISSTVPRCATPSSSGMRTSGSNLCRLRSGARASSSNCP